MADGTGLLKRFRGLAQRDVEPAAVIPMDRPRSANQMLDGCEYEIRQMRREVQDSRTARLATPVAPARTEPFVLGVRLRDAEFRARLAATGVLPRDCD
jgi:hypothetical protein